MGKSVFLLFYWIKFIIWDQTFGTYFTLQSISASIMGYTIPIWSRSLVNLYKYTLHIKMDKTFCTHSVKRNSLRRSWLLLPCRTKPSYSTQYFCTKLEVDTRYISGNRIILCHHWPIQPLTQDHSWRLYG